MTKSEFKRRVQIITAVCVLVLLSGLVILVGQLISMANLNSKKVALTAKSEELNKEIKLLEQELEYRQSAKYLEQYAREIYEKQKGGI